jgi:hypothetical protein
MDAGAVRALLLALPEVEEYDHGGLPAFRVRGKRFASMLDGSGVNLVPGEEAVRAAVAQWPDACREEWFGTRLAAVRVAFAGLAVEVVDELVFDAWAAKAPKRLAAAALAERRRA